MEPSRKYPIKDTPMLEKLLLSFNDQFATNQNHHQSVFLQFLSAILIVLIGYGYVYANTNINAAMDEITRMPVTSAIVSYAVVHLIGTFIVCQFILTLLGTVILNIGYGFRRDQKVIYNIRERYLVGNKYKELFGTKSFDPAGHSIIDFLPEFNRMFFFGIFTLQALLLGSFIYHLKQLQYFSWFHQAHCLNYLVYVFPLIWSVGLYFNYYKKYYWVMTDSKECFIRDWFRSKANKKNKRAN